MLCIERPEQHGRLNIIPVSLQITQIGAQATPLVFASGGKRECLNVAPGPASVVLRFPYPYGGPGEAARYWERVESLSLASGANAAVLDTTEMDTDASGWEQTGWHDMWRLRIVGR